MKSLCVGLKHLAGAGIFSFVLITTSTTAQPSYPNQAIKFVVPYAAGGSSDTRARQLAQRLSASLGVPVVVENKPGASGNIGTAQVAASKPDGYTIGLGNFAPMAVNKALYTLNFDPIAVNDLIAGNVDLYLELPSLLMAYAIGDTPRLRLLAVSSDTRVPSLPDVPTFKEQGLPGMVMSNWFGVVAPTGVPDEVIQTLNIHINRALQDPVYRKTVQAQGGEVVGGSPAAFRDFITNESARWSQLIRTQNISVQ